MSKPDAIHKTATISFGADFSPSLINLPLSVVIEHRALDEAGSSQVTVLLEALALYRERAQEWHNDESQRDLVLTKIDEIETVLQAAVMERLSAACDLLSDIRFDRPNTDRRREPLT